VLSFGEMWNNLVLLSMLGLKYPTYISDRSQPDKNLGRLHNFLRKTLYPRAHGIILQTKYATEFAKSKKRNKNIVKIGNPVRALKLPNVEKTNNIITVGRLIPTKNIDKLIELFSKINPDGWELTIIGGNAKKTNLLEIYRNQIKHLGMSNKINLLGKQNDVDYHLAKSKIFAFTSTSEGFPNALAEGMKAGCACIAFDCVAGPSDIIDDGINGFLIPENDYDEFQRKVEILIKDSKLRDKFGREAKTKMKNFEQTAIAESFFNFMLEHENSN
jgi:GalNAc-alpha-(1->4)-GalNAc-alpha-(1->3)-diNAcBac-PP-undecaprenol alpha-1,4-N-acetyl-D-galactosaminyltransferase